MKIVTSKIINVLIFLLILFISIFLLPDRNIVFGESNPDLLLLTETERLWLKTHPVIRLAPDPEFKPIEFFDDKGNYRGIGADYVRLIERKIGIKFDIIKYENWEDVITHAKQRKVDILNAVVKTPQRKKYLLFPTPYLTIPSVIIARKTVTKDLTLDMLRGMHVVMVSGYGYVDLIHNKYPEIDIDLVSDLRTALRKVSFGMADAFVGDLATASFYIEQEGITNLKLAGESEPPNISGFAVRSDWPELCNILEKGISLITEKEKKDIRKSWIHLGYTAGLTNREVRNIILGIITILFVIIGGFLLWNLMLNRKVHTRTQDLRKEITEREKAEQALRESEKRFLDLSQNSTDWIWEFDENEIFTYASPRIKNLLGYAPEEIIGQSAFAPMSSPEANKVYEEFIQFKKERKPFSNLINVNKHKNGKDVILESSGVPIIDSKGNFCGYRGIDRDITERTYLEEQLRQIHKMEAIGNLAGGIAHDFNNILSPIIAYSEIAMIETEPGSPVYNSLKQIYRAGERARDLVKHILTFARKHEEELIQINASLVIKEVMKFLRSTIPATIEIKYENRAERDIVFADPTQLNQIIMNLCTNAAHSMEKGGTLEVILENVEPDSYSAFQIKNLKPGRYIKLSISDTGHGIKPELMDKIFEPYFTTKGVGKGTGIGLALVHGIVEAYEGTITVHSEIGKGTCFSVYLPVVEGDLYDDHTLEDQAQPPCGTERILLVDDEKDVVDVMESILERLGYKLTSRTSSIEALEAFRNKPDEFDLVITDMTMPNMTGKDLAKEMINIRPDIPIILCTGFSEQIDGEKAREIGISAFIMKPIVMRKIAQTIREVFDKK